MFLSHVWMADGRELSPAPPCFSIFLLMLPWLYIRMTTWQASEHTHEPLFFSLRKYAPTLTLAHPNSF